MLKISELLAKFKFIHANLKNTQQILTNPKLFQKRLPYIRSWKLCRCMQEKLATSGKNWGSRHQKCSDEYHCKNIVFQISLINIATFLHSSIRLLKLKLKMSASILPPGKIILEKCCKSVDSSDCSGSAEDTKIRYFTESIKTSL